MPAIHVIKKSDPNLPRTTPVTPGADTYRSGNWAVAEETATRLVGGKMYLHRTQAARSFFGGTITSFQVIPEGVNEGRVVFTFDFDKRCRNVRTSREGWSQEMKIIL